MFSEILKGAIDETLSTMVLLPNFHVSIIRNSHLMYLFSMFI